MVIKAVPRLRFKGFETNYKTSKLGKVSKVFDGVYQTPKYVDKGIPFISVENIDTLRTNKYITKKAFINNFKYKMPNVNDIVMTRIGTVGKVNILKNTDVAYYVTLALIHPNHNYLLSYYLLYLMQSNNVQKELWGRTLHVAFPQKINKDEIPKITIIYPSLPEQRQIGEFFTILDYLIHLQQKKITLLKRLKKAYLQKLFPCKGETTPKIRFKGFHNKWVIKKLKNLVTYINTGKSKRKDLYKNRTSIYKYPFISASTLKGFSRTYDYKGVILLCTRVGSVGYLHLVNGKFQISDNTIVIKSKENLYFIIGLLKTQEFQRIAEGSSQKLIREKELEQLLLLAPKFEEQKEINKFLKILNIQIKNQSYKIEELFKLKKAYLQKMFC